MENKAQKTLEKYKMLEMGDTVVVGLSGGADSCALFHFLLSQQKKMKLRIIACHVNHLLRGQEADRDEEFVRCLCRRCEVELKLLRIDIAKEAALRRESTEKTGRDVRYEFFKRTADEYGARIATAHTASDNAETVIFNMTRGSGVHGLCGIPPVRGNIIRPLIEVTRAEVEKYCRDNGYEYVTDSTNLTEDYTRNKLRLNVVPVLKEINPSFDNTMALMSGRMREISEYINMQSKNTLQTAKTDKGYKAEILDSADSVIFAEMIRILLSEYDIIPEAVHISLIKKILSSSGAVELKYNIFAVSKQGFLRIIKKSESNITDTDPEIAFEEQKTVVINDKKISLEIINMEEFNNRKKNTEFLFDNLLDCDTIPLTAVFRTGKSGDRISLARRRVTKPVRKLFMELKIPQEERSKRVLLADGSEVLWAEGAGVSSECAVTENTKRVLILSVAE